MGTIARNVSDQSSASAFIKNNLELVHKENKTLKQKVEQLERENRDLKKSVYELSFRHNAVIQQLGKSAKPFNIDTALGEDGEGGGRGERGAAQLGASEPGGVDANARHDPGTLDAPSSSKPVAAHLPTEGRKFYLSYDLKGHTGPVYVAKFSPSGNLLASGSFDRSVRVWDVGTQSEVCCLQEHGLNVADLCWSADSATLLSGGFDKAVKEWDVGRGELVATRAVEGFAQAVTFNPVDDNLFLVGTTAKRVYVFDRRERGGAAVEIENESMVNALYCYRNGQTALTGDNGGLIKSWDLRKGECVESTANGEDRKPISSVDVSRHPSSDGRAGEEGRYLAVNSYDNVLRVYGRGSFIVQPKPSSKAQLRMLHAVKGHRNKNWPIRSSFFHGPEYLGNSSYQTGDPEKDKKKDSPPGGAGRDEGAGRKEEGAEHSVYGALLLATGSADNHAYIYDVGGPEGSGELIQKLEGHTDRVYSASFHPEQPVLATGSADFSVKIWAPRNLGFVPAI